MPIHLFPRSVLGITRWLNFRVDRWVRIMIDSDHTISREDNAVMLLHLCRTASDGDVKCRRPVPSSSGSVAVFALLFLLSGTPLWAQAKATEAHDEKSAAQTTLAVASPGINFR